MIVKWLKHIHYEWPIIYLFIFLSLQAYFQWSIWFVIPVLLLVIRLVTLRNIQTFIISIAILIVIICHSLVQSHSLREIENLPIAGEELQAVLMTDPLDVEIAEDSTSIRGEGKVVIIHNKQVYEFTVDFIQWLQEGEVIPPTIKEKTSIWDITGKFNKPPVARNFHVFDYREYLKANNIVWQLEITNIESISENQSLLSKIKNLRFKILEQFMQHNNQEWLALHNKLLLNVDSQHYQNFKEHLTALGIAHFFAISGFHIYFIRRLLNYVFLRLGMRQEIAQVVIFVILSVYTWLIKWPVGVIRVLVMNMVSYLSKRYHIPLSRLDTLAITGTLLLIVNPLNALSLGYTLSFMMTFVVMMYGQSSIREHEMIQNFEMTVACLLLSWPIIIQISFEWNVIQVLIVILCTVLFNRIIMPLIFITTFSIVVGMPEMFGLTELLNKLLILFNNNIKEVEILSLFNRVIGKLPFWTFFLLILVAMFYLYNIHTQPYRSYGGILIMYTVIIIVVPFLNPVTKVTILDVGQGDATLIQRSNNRGNWLIDTGGRRLWEEIDGSNMDKNYAEKNIIPALKALGVNQLDGVIITHPDIDHIGSLVPLSQEIQIDTLWVSEYTLESEIWTEIESELIAKQVIVLKQGEEYILSNVPLKIYSAPHRLIQYSANESNDSSLIVQFKLGEWAFLNLGDVTQEIEERLLKEFPEIRGDILKIAHHGSDTSTSEWVLQTLKPKLALISAGLDNQYGHPHSEVLEKLEGHSIAYLSTASVGAIQMRYCPFRGFEIDTAIEIEIDNEDTNNLQNLYNNQ